MKKCKRCRKKKSISEFDFNNENKDRLQIYCKICSKEMSWERKLHRDYNMTIKQYELMLKSQNGVCKICGQPETATGRNGKIKQLAVDHEHPTGKIRGLLCARCNLMLGMIKDNPELLRKAAEYLEKMNGKSKTK